MRGWEWAPEIILHQAADPQHQGSTRRQPLELHCLRFAAWDEYSYSG